MSKRNLFARLFVLLLSGFAVAGSALAALPVGISGAWYNPAQSGHGLSVELLDHDRALVFWYVYDAQGNPVFLYIEGQVVGRRIDGIARAPRGMRFGVFDPATLAVPIWGQVSLDFTDCTRATLRWNSFSPEYGTGEMPLYRLASLATLPCSLPPLNTVRSGLYEGILIRGGSDGPQSHARGIVDGDGKLWALERWTASEEPPNSPSPGGVISGPYYCCSDVQAVISAEIVNPQTLRSTMRTLSNGWLRGGSFVEFGEGGWRPQLVDGVPRPQALFFGLFNSTSFYATGIHTQRWYEGAADGVQLVSPVALAQIAGDYRIIFINQFAFQGTGQISVGADGNLCIKARFLVEGCEFVGTLSTSDGHLGVIDFEVRTVVDEALIADPGVPIYRGRGWLSQIAGAPVLTLVGDNGNTGFGLIGHKLP